MDDSNSEDVGFYYEWSADSFMTTSWTYHVMRHDPPYFKLLGIVKRGLAESGPQVHRYLAFENVQYTNMAFPTLEEAKAWVVACTMGEKP